MSSTLQTPLFTNPQALNNHPELFQDPERPAEDCEGPFIIVCDNFYSQPEIVRELALSKPYYQYKPPLAEQVGEAIASEYPDPALVWESTALLCYLGTQVKTPQPGFRYAGSDVIDRLETLIPDKIHPDTWDESGDWWNGAFHLQYEAGDNVHRVIHHHYREGDVTPRGWSGVVYLSPDAPEEHGTTIWKDKSTGLCIAQKGNRYDDDKNRFELALQIENRFNRLVLFRENVLHRAGHGFGHNRETARLMQTFFFQTQPR